MCYGVRRSAVQYYQPVQPRVVREVVVSPQPAAPSPSKAIDVALAGLNLTSEDLFYDIGCGDGRVLIRAAQLYGCLCIGIEKDTRTSTEAMLAVERAGLTDRIRIYLGDGTKCDLSQATAVYMYLEQDTVNQIVPRLPDGCRVASFLHTLPVASHLSVVGGQPVFFWTPEWELVK